MTDSVCSAAAKPGSSLTNGLSDFARPVGPDLAARCEPLAAWVNDAKAEGLFPFIRHHILAPDTHAEVVDFGGRRYTGVNLGSQDYLGLARHPAVIEASARATLEMGTHSAGSEPMGGALAATRQLETELADFLGKRHVVLFPTGWGAGYGAIRALMRPDDQIVIDALAHNCLREGAVSSGARVSVFAHNHLRGLERSLRRAVEAQRSGATLVVTESLFSMDSDHPDFRDLIALCRAYGASLLVDVAHDLGVLGPHGRGVLAEQGVLLEVDLVMGSFSKSFACLGGFVATDSEAMSYYLRGFSGTHTFSNALMPAQLAAVRAALQIAASEEGDALRSATMANADALRQALTQRGVLVLGRQSPIVLPLVGPEAVARIAQRECLRRGVIINAVEFPACSRGAARFRMQVTPRHERHDLGVAAHIVADAIAWARTAHEQGDDAEAPEPRQSGGKQP